MDILNRSEIEGYIVKKTETLQRYTEMLSGYSGRLRLTGPGEREILWNRHILDSSWGLPLLPESGRVIDVGTGGGLPGMVWAICRPDLEFFLLDSIGRKCAALEEMASRLELANVKVICDRSEVLSATMRETFDVASARAVTKAGALAEYLSPLTMVGGSILAFKGPKVWQEIEDVGNRWDILGLDNPEIFPYVIEDIENYLVRWHKKEPCPLKYPRRPGVAERKPWWR